MRKLLGLLVVFVGVGGLGYWAQENHAVAIENAVKADVAALDLKDFENVHLSVSGRDITLEGRVTTEAEREDLLRRLAELPSHRHIHDALELEG